MGGARMFGFLSPARRETADPLTDTASVDAFWRTLPADDPIAAQTAVCGALADLVVRNSPGSDRLRGVLTLDQRGRTLIDALLVNGVGGNPSTPSQEAQSRQAAFELCRSLGRVHSLFLGSMPGSRSTRGNECLPYLVLCLFQHRQMELALRPFVDERSTRFPWADVHKVYRFAQSRDLLQESLPVKLAHSASVADTTLEREYIHVLLSDLVNGGHFPPRDAIWITRSLPRWSAKVALHARRDGRTEPCFLVDPDSDSGAVRSSLDSPGSRLCLDTAPALAAIREEIASLRGIPNGPGESSQPEPRRQLKVLRRLSDVCAPERPVISRRGERKPLALTVEVAVGLPHILRALRGRPESGASGAPRLSATGDGSTVTGFGDLGAATGTYFNGPNTVTQGSVPAAGTAHPTMAMVDRSDSGCRLLGPTVVTNPILPGGLIAFREDAATPWSLAVVRRVKKRLAGKRVEVGLEYIGQDPRWVVVVVPEADTGAAGPSVPVAATPPRFAALFLAESANHPVLPMKTLVLPSRGLAPDDRLSVRSRSAIHTIQLKEPLEEQAEFIWSPFDILDRWLKDEPAPAKPPQQSSETTA